MLRPVNSANNSPIISRSAAGREIGDALKAFVGRGREWTVKQLSNKSGVPDRRIECAMVDPANAEDFRPLGIDHLLSIALVLGSDFTDLWIHLAQQGAFPLGDGDTHSPGNIAAENAEDNATVARAAKDGAFSSDDLPELGVVGRRMIERGQRLVSIAHGKLGEVAA